MRRWQRRLMGVLALVMLASVLIGDTAWAQGRGGITVRSRRGGTWGPPPALRSETPLFAPWSSGSLERNFGIMRNTSPNPRLYMGGQLNPQISGLRGGGNDFYLGAGVGSGYGYGPGGYFGSVYPGYGYLAPPGPYYLWGYDW
jgi:hypothetical protein